MHRRGAPVAGRLAWLEHRVPDGDAQVDARSAAGATVTLATAPPRSVTELAISPDGATVTWVENGTPRSAAMP